MKTMDDILEDTRLKLTDRRLKIRPMCKKIGVSVQTIYKIIQKKGKPRIDTLEKIIEYLETVDHEKK